MSSPEKLKVLGTSGGINLMMHTLERNILDSPGILEQQGTGLVEPEILAMHE